MYCYQHISSWKETVCLLSQTRHGDVLTMILECVGSHTSLITWCSIFFTFSNKESTRKSSSEVSCSCLLVDDVKEENWERQGFLLLCSLSLCAFSSQHESDEPNAVPGQKDWKAGQLLDWLIEARASFPINVCELVGLIWVSEDCYH